MGIYKISLLLSLSLFVMISVGRSTYSMEAVKNTAPGSPKIIFDTDMGPDYDDIGAIAVLHALADRGECEILATVASDRHPSIAPTLEVFNRYFNRGDLPVGIAGKDAPGFTASNNWNDTIIRAYAPELKGKQYPDAVSIYRKVLAGQPDHSVTIVTVGFLSNISDLLNSEADAHSGLNGMDLVKKKVKQLVAMAGGFPEGNEFNVNKHASASVEVFSKWPVPILFSGFEIGARIFTGGRVAEMKIKSPVVHGYAYNLKTFKKQGEKNRPSWDQTAVLIAVRNPETYFYVNGPGKFLVQESGANTWDSDTDAGHYFISHRYPYGYMENLIEELMSHQP